MPCWPDILRAVPSRAGPMAKYSQLSARRRGTHHFSRSHRKPLGESTESATAMAMFRGSCLSFSGIIRTYALYPALQPHSFRLHFYLLFMPRHALMHAIYPPILEAYHTASFGGGCGRSPRFGISWRLQIEELQCGLCYTARTMRAGTCVRVGFVPNCQSLTRGGDESEVKASIILGWNVGDH